MMKQFPTQMFGIAITASVLTLTGCGGGGGSGSANLNDPASPSVSLDVNGQKQIPVQSADSYLYPNQTNVYTSRIVANVRGSDGNLATAGEVQFNLSAADNSTGAIYETDFETTETVVGPDGEEFDVPAAFVNLPVEVGGGNAQALFQAHTRTGNAEVCASYTDPDTGATGRDCVTFEVTAASGTDLPASIDAKLTNMPLYVTGQSRSTQANIRATLLDPAEQPVRNPENHKNIQARIDGSDLGGARLTGSDGQRGQVVQARTVGNTGIADIGIQSGTESGTLRVLLTADGADNNVENGIDEPVETEMTVAISDGRVASISFGSPYVNAIRNNESNIALDEDDSFDAGVYSRAVSVTVQDRNGNPVPNEDLTFGLIDAPLARDFPVDLNNQPTLSIHGDFAVAGLLGNPSFGGTTFTQADNTDFLNLAVGKTDQLLLHPNPSGHERELRSKREISSVTGPTSLTVKDSFPVPTLQADPGAVIPWVIGRAQYGNVTANATTNQLGVATITVNYPVSRLNQPAILTATASNGITDHEVVRYAGIAGGQLTSSVTEIYARWSRITNQQVRLCATDANEVPRPKITIQSNLPTTNISTDPTTLITNQTGCIDFEITVQRGLENDTELQFSSGNGENETVTINVTADEEPEPEPEP